MPAAPALPVCRGALPARAAGALRGDGTSGPLPLRARCGRTSDGRLAPRGAHGTQRGRDMNEQARLLEARALSRHYLVSRGMLRPKGLVRALDGVTFSLRDRETLAVVSESGCGKSTLARAVTMIERPTSGALELSGTDVIAADRATLK